jgi:ribosomal protein S18 acetylase RimI-like enzyme
LLAVNPTIQSRGFGTGIMRHLVDEAAVLASRRRRCHDVLFLDVYTDNQKAIALYTKFGFTALADEPRPDPDEGGRLYIVMARRVSVGQQ